MNNRDRGGCFREEMSWAIVWTRGCIVRDVDRGRFFVSAGTEFVRAIVNGIVESSPSRHCDRGPHRRRDGTLLEPWSAPLSLAPPTTRIRHTTGDLKRTLPPTRRFNFRSFRLPFKRTTVRRAADYIASFAGEIDTRPSARFLLFRIQRVMHALLGTLAAAFHHFGRLTDIYLISLDQVVLKTVWLLGCIECMRCGLFHLSICRSVCLSRASLCKHGWTDRGPAWIGMETHGDPCNIVLEVSPDFPTNSIRPSPYYFGRLLSYACTRTCRVFCRLSCIAE